MSSLLDKINYPHDLRSFNKQDLPLIAEELRKELIDAVSTTDIREKMEEQEQEIT